ncbi:MAG: hypothetical protein ACTSWM_02870 [Alphaproteobacteria bacterium]
MTNLTALLFAEDTGAANYLAPMPHMLEQLGLRSHMFASPHAARHFENLGVTYQTASEGARSTALMMGLNPRLLVVGTGINLDSVGLDLITAARKAGVESVGVVDQRQNLGDRFRGHAAAPLSQAPDWILVPDPVSHDYYLDQGAEPGHVILCGHPHFDRIYEIARNHGGQDRPALRAQLLPDCPPDAHIVMFAAEPARRVRGSVGAYRKSPDYTLAGRGQSPYRTDIVLEELLDTLAAIDEPLYKVLRLHPHDPEDREFSAYYDEFDHISHGGLPHQLIFASDLVVGMSSMLLIEAALLGRPTLSIVPRPRERAMLLSAEVGLTPCVHTRQDLHAILPRLLTGPGHVDPAAVRDVFPPDSTARLRDFFAARLTNAQPSSPTARHNQPMQETGN